MYHGIGTGALHERDEDEGRVPNLRKHRGRTLPIHVEVIDSGQVVQAAAYGSNSSRRRRRPVEIRREHEGELWLHERLPAERSIVHVWSFGIVTRSMNGEQYTISKRSGNPRRVGRPLMASVRAAQSRTKKRRQGDRLDRDTFARRAASYCLPRDGLGTPEAVTAARSSRRVITMRMP